MGGKCMEKVKAQRCWKPFMKFVRFTTHFMFVMFLLGFGAFGFALIEDPVPSENDGEVKNGTLNVSKGWQGDDTFFNYLNQHYNISIREEEREKFLRDIRKHEKWIRMVVNKDGEKHRLHDRMYIFKKWFYFVTIATTTIGYGDIYPVTKLGKIFYTGFSIVGIPLMMTLLALCGDIMTIVNTKIFGLINRFLCKKRQLISEELLSSFSILILFFGYISVGCIYVYYELKWDLVDSIYFWVVTFTTVGFGDLYIALDEQEDWMIGFLILYRLFGLALLAGLIDSLCSWMNKRKEMFKEKAALLKKQNLLAGNSFLSRDSKEQDATECDEFISDSTRDVDLAKLTPKKISYC